MLVPITTHSKVRTRSGTKSPLVLCSRLRAKTDSKKLTQEESNILRILNLFDPVILERDEYTSNSLSEFFNLQEN